MSDGTTRVTVVISLLTVLVLGMTGSAPVTAGTEERQSSCSGRDWSGEVECAFSYQGTTLVAGMYGTGLLTVEVAGIAGTREILASCVADGYGCVTGRGENRESLPIGTPLFCHVRGQSGTKFACLSRTPPEDGQDVIV